MIKCNKAVIVASGVLDAPKLLKAELLNKENYIICDDGGIRHLYKAGIMPDMWIGDFDSAKNVDFSDFNFESFYKKAEKECKIIKLNPIKDETDFEYTARFIRENTSIKYVKIFGATGGRIDHTLSNIFTLKTFLDYGIVAEIYDSHNIIKMFKGEIEVKKCDYKYLSIIPLSINNRISLKGVKYEISGECLNPYTSRGISNEITEDIAYIKSDAETILILSDDKKKG